MPYATQADLVTAFGEQDILQLTDIDTPEQGGIVAARVDEALARASAEVDSYLAARYQLPLAEVPDALKGAVLDLAYAFLHRTSMPEHVEAAASRARRYLRDLSDGRATLALAAGGAAAVAPALPEMNSGGRVFERGDW